MVTIVALVAAVLLLLGGLTPSWWAQAADSMDAFIGLRVVRMCTEAKGCVDTGLGSMAEGSGWVRAGAAAYAAALMAGALLLVTAGSAAVGRVRLLVARTALVAVVCAGVVGVAFVWQAPGYMQLQPGYSMYAYGAGVLMGAAAALAALRLGRGTGSAANS